MAISRRGLLKLGVSGVAASYAPPPTFTSTTQTPIGQQVGAGTRKPIRLDRNENAYGPSPNPVAEVLKNAHSVNRFPGSSDVLRSSLASAHGVRREQILLGAGSTAIMKTAMNVFLRGGRGLVLATPTFELIDRYAVANSARMSAVPLRRDHGHDLEAMLAAVNSQTGLIYICNPNNPTGTLTDRQGIDRFLEKLPARVPVMIDEAYHDYAGGSGAYVSFLDRLSHHPGVIVTRTFSEVYGLAGLRLGYAVAQPKILNALAREKPEMEIGSLTLAAGLAALADTEFTASCVQRNQNDRQEFVNQVNARMLRVLDSHTNFACLNVMHPAKEIIEHYQKNDILLGPEIPGMPNYVRVSFGAPEEMREFWAVWDLLGEHRMAM
ncbi:MAG TPA: aminotransferase class I/II-fold pyridoxal phosphate-dependent enzyme [Chthoniobacterales bacterium]|jgi:histidinol-phosphate aminotransferase|nr:aminotransferase class I/II-fold pyridoxal phosphate-dependent enzyme [Chthoniobacterales bacterium]HXM13206.1 aminotransferase class I/II-fold pyridoxal phosphate-dependent enzyme [Terriglobales bacterium]